MDHFTIIFAPKLITSLFNLLRQNVVDIQNRPLYGKVHPSSTAYQEYLMTFKLKTSRVVQRARPFITGIGVVDIQRVKEVIHLYCRQRTMSDNLREQFQFNSTMIICSANNAFLIRRK